MTLRLYLIRHGETEWSLSGQYTGRTDIPLTARGEDEARELGLRIRNITFARVLTSPLKRAQQTCALAGLVPAAEVEPDLAEWDNGDDEGHTPADILTSRPGWNLFRDGSPQGETPVQISDRADRLITRVRAWDGNIALFSHGHFGRVLATRWIGLSVAQAEHFQFNTASLSILGYDSRHPEVPIIAQWNAAPHERLDLGSNPCAREADALKQRALARWESDGGEVENEQRNREHTTPTSTCDISLSEGI